MYYSIPIIAAFILDMIIGDPQGMPHPVRYIGKLITRLSGDLRKKPGNERRKGVVLMIITVMTTFIIALAVTIAAYSLSTAAGIIVETVLCYFCIAAKDLCYESMKVYKDLEATDTENARYHLSWIVGRDTDILDENGIARAAVETVAENTSDGVTAPLFYMMIGGAPAAYTYKAINTLDSMVGYKNDEFIDFGRASSLTDDVVNYIPSRITALYMCAAAYILGMDGKAAYRVWKRDRRKHESPNSAQGEAAAAGALGIVLGGGAYYKGVFHERPLIGDSTREIEKEDIKRVNRLMYTASILFMLSAAALRGLMCVAFMTICNRVTG